MPMIRFDRYYILLAVCLLVVEVLIALYVHDNFIRPCFGDVLVVVLVYCAVRSVCDTPILPTAVGVLVFAIVIEMLQYFKFIRWLGWQHSRLANVVLGNTFSFSDIAAYIIGIVAVLLLEGVKSRRAV